MPTSYHVIVVGSGCYGIAAAKTYLQIDSSVSLLVVDDGPSVGGVWNRSRIYPNLYANQPTPVFEYSDWTMKDAIGVEDWTDLTGDNIAEYFEKYAAKFGVTDHCRFNTQVQTIERVTNEGKWRVLVKPTPKAQPENASGRKEEELEELYCNKLIMATGFTSVPKLPENVDFSQYSGKCFHVKELGQNYQGLLDDKTIKEVTVIGGSKSAWEAAGMFALGGKKVRWLIREEGMGPAPMGRARPDGKKHLLEGKNIRSVTALAPSPYNPDRWLTKFLYGGGNFVGRWFSANFWRMPLKADMAKLKISPNRKIMTPVSDSLFWVPAGFAMSHASDENIWKAIDDGKHLSITRTSIISAIDKTLTLQDGTAISADAIILATGWKSPWAPLFSPKLAEDLEMPVPLTLESEPHKEHWARLEAAAKEKIHQIHPFITNPPEHLPLHLLPKPTMSSTHHFRNIVPPAWAARGDRNIVFLGYLHTGMQTIHAQACSIWSYAYLENSLPPKDKAPLAALLEDQPEMERQTAWTDTWFRTRYLGIFGGILLATFETREVVDRILLDLGIRPDRKALLVDKKKWWGLFYDLRCFFAEWFDSYSSAEYNGMLKEYLDIVGNKRGDGDHPRDK